jgi:TatD DNase family protein
MYYDIHSHLNDARFADDLDQVLVRMRQKSVITNCIGYDLESSERALSLAQQHEEVFAIVGFHPDHVAEYDQERMEGWLKEDVVVGVGECGFDWFRVDRESAYNEQERVFRLQIELALRHDLPLMFHIRPSVDAYDAYTDALNVLKPYKEQHGDALRGNFHFFAGNREVLEQILELGFDVSYTGVITWAPEYAELVAATPLDRMHVETDAPYVAPTPYRGKRAEPVYVEEMIKKIAEVHNTEFELVRDRIMSNSRKMFNQG